METLSFLRSFKLLVLTLTYSSFIRVDIRLIHISVIYTNK
jgi:hypothetical protein